MYTNIWVVIIHECLVHVCACVCICVCACTHVVVDCLFWLITRLHIEMHLCMHFHICIVSVLFKAPSKNLLMALLRTAKNIPESLMEIVMMTVTLAFFVTRLRLCGRNQLQEICGARILYL